MVLIKLDQEEINLNIDNALIRLSEEYNNLTTLFIDTRFKTRENRKQIDKLEQDIAENKKVIKTLKNELQRK